MKAYVIRCYEDKSHPVYNNQGRYYTHYYGWGMLENALIYNDLEGDCSVNKRIKCLRSRFAKDPRFQGYKLEIVEIEITEVRVVV